MSQSKILKYCFFNVILSNATEQYSIKSVNNARSLKMDCEKRAGKPCGKTVRGLSTCHLGGAAENVRENRAETFNLSSRIGGENRAEKPCGDFQPIISEGLRKTCGKTMRGL